MKNKKNREKRKLRLELVDTMIPANVEWLYQFIHKNHSAPKFILPTRKDLRSLTHKFYKAWIVLPRASRAKLLGLTSYEIRTPYLAETQRTILAPEFRGQGWGVQLSQAIEDKVKKAGFCKIRSCIYHDNFSMLQIKLAQGYIIEGFHPHHDGPGLHEYSLGKILKGSLIVE